jgi:primosomal replication protein N
MLAGAALGSGIRIEGFLSAKGRRSRKIVLHVTRVEFVNLSVEGN